MDIPFLLFTTLRGLPGTLYSLAFSSDDRYLMSCHTFSPYRENPDRISHAYLTYDHINYVLVMVKAALVLTLVGRIESLLKEIKSSSLHQITIESEFRSIGFVEQGYGCKIPVFSNYG